MIGPAHQACPDSCRRALTFRKGQFTVEYALTACAFVAALAVGASVLGVKTVDVTSMTTSTLPGAHPTDNQAVEGGELFPLVNDAGTVRLNMDQVMNDQGTSRLGKALGDEDIADLVNNEARVD